LCGFTVPLSVAPPALIALAAPVVALGAAPGWSTTSETNTSVAPALSVTISFGK
jgi:hypothetical protein